MRSLLPILAFFGIAAGEPYKPSYRISPIDGSKIALPTKEQLAFQDREIGVLIHFDIATFLNIDGCNADPSLVPNETLFDPAQLNTDQWMQSATALGAKYATLVVKHNCGFALWPSNVTFPTLDEPKARYNYTTADTPLHGEDIVRKFITSAAIANVGHGFYYSVVVNNFLNVQQSEVRNGSLAPGQVGITEDTYNQIVYDMLTELWSNYGKLTEIWFDGGYSAAQQDKLQTLLQSHQPQAVVFNGCQENGTCVSSNSIRWVGNEMGLAPEENWSTGVTNDGGDASSPYFCPAECDTTLQTQDHWFYLKDQPLRSLKEMIGVYHTTVGRNCMLELDLAPDPRGLIPDAHAARYKELGDFINSCYGRPIAHKIGCVKGGKYEMRFDEPTTVDRVVLMEDQTNGQVIRSYGVYGKVAGEWMLLSNGTSVGHKKIDLFKEVKVTEVMVNSTFVDEPRWRSVSVHHCLEGQ